MKRHTMRDVARAFGYFAYVIRAHGRRRDRAALEIRMRWVHIDPLSHARTAPMASRAERRARVLELRREAKHKFQEATKRDLREGFFFRPVYGYVGPAFMPLNRGEAI